MCFWYLDLSLYKKVMVGKGGDLGCLKIHCGECSHLLLHSTLGFESGIGPFQLLGVVVGEVEVVDNKLGGRVVVCKL